MLSRPRPLPTGLAVAGPVPREMEPPTRLTVLGPAPTWWDTTGDLTTLGKSGRDEIYQDARSRVSERAIIEDEYGLRLNYT